MSQSVRYMPDILRSSRADGAGSISVLRALKHIREQLEFSQGEDYAVQVAIDDCETMIAAVALGRGLEAQSC